MPLTAFSLDLDRCVGCQACTVACKTGNERPPGDNYIQVRDIVSGQLPALFGSFAHHRCFHCAEAACVAVCPTGTLTKAENGLTAVDQDKCSGCGYCTDACPYKIPTVVNGRVSKCVGCLDIVEGDGTPYCVQTCPSQALGFGPREEVLAAVHARAAALQVRYPNAQVYGEWQLGGLGLLTVLLDNPSVYGLPAAPALPAVLGAWQRVVQPLTVPLAGLSVAFTGLAFVIARRQRLQHTAEAVVAPAGVQAEAVGAAPAALAAGAPVEAVAAPEQPTAASGPEKEG